jgi:phospholipid N-methyltransferase
MQKTKRRITSNSLVCFIGEYLKHPRELGTFTQSSQFLVKGILNEISGKYIIELGAGTGPVTKGILRHLPENGKLISFEINPSLYKHLEKITDPRFIPVKDSAENLEYHLEKMNFDADCIVSGLPLTSLKRTTRNKILEACSKHSQFIQYKYWGSKKLLEDYFLNVNLKHVLRNFPPAVIYTCSNL